MFQKQRSFTPHPFPIAAGGKTSPWRHKNRRTCLAPPNCSRSCTLPEQHSRADPVCWGGVSNPEGMSMREQIQPPSLTANVVWARERCSPFSPSTSPHYLQQAWRTHPALHKLQHSEEWVLHLP